MSIEKAKLHLKKYDADTRVIEFDDSSATVELAAQRVGCSEAEIAKTLSFKSPDGVVILIVCAGDSKIDNQKFKGKFGFKAKMLAFDEVESLCGHAVGGVCPFGVNEGVQVYLDSGMKRFDNVYPAAGGDNTAIKLSIEELEKFSECIDWIDVCKF